MAVADPDERVRFTEEYFFPAWRRQSERITRAFLDGEDLQPYAVR